VSTGSTSSAPGRVAGPQQRRDLLAEAARTDEGQALHPLGELVGELHGDAATERVADDGDAVVAERVEQVAQSVRVRAEGVVAARLGRRAVPEQVGRDDVRAVAELGHHALPLLGPRGDAVHQQHDRAGTAVRPAAVAGLAVRHGVTVDAGPGPRDGRHGLRTLPRSRPAGGGAAAAPECARSRATPPLDSGR
jgi:hypothetical protein